MSRRAVITGLGIIAPNGIGKDNYWNAIISGESGIKEISSFDTSQYPTKIGGEVTDFNPSNYMEKRKASMLSRFAQFALVATNMAIEDSKLKIDNEDPYKMGIAIGSSLGGRNVDEEQFKTFFRSGYESMNPLATGMVSTNFAAGVIAAEYGIKGPNATLSTGCNSALNSIGYSFEIIKNNRADIIIAGGSETPLSPGTFGGFCISGVLSKKNGRPEKVSRPFEKNRDGYVLAEGCGIIIIEELEHALLRNANIYAEIKGYGVTNDGFSIIRMEPTGKEAAKAIQIAMETANVKPEDIDYINAHGSSSQVSDKRETNAIKLALGEERAYEVPISSIKSMIGQPLAATGGMQAVTTAMAIKNNQIPPTINYEEEDPVCDLDYTPNKTKTYNVNTALINSFGLGGNNASVVLGKYVPENAMCGAL